MMLAALAERWKHMRMGALACGGPLLGRGCFFKRLDSSNLPPLFSNTHRGKSQHSHARTLVQAACTPGGDEPKMCSATQPLLPKHLVNAGDAEIDGGARFPDVLACELAVLQILLTAALLAPQEHLVCGWGRHTCHLRDGTEGYQAHRKILGHVAVPVVRHKLPVLRLVARMLEATVAMVGVEAFLEARGVIRLRCIAVNVPLVDAHDQVQVELWFGGQPM